VGPRAGLDAVAKRKTSHHGSLREINPGCTPRSLVTTLTELRVEDVSVPKYYATKA